MNILRHLYIALAIALFVGCGDNSRKRPQPDRSATIKAPDASTGVEPAALATNITPGKIGGTLTLPLVGDPRTFNPLAAHDRSSETITRLLFSSLTRFNWTTQEPEPDLAHQWSVAEDGRTWTWRLRRNLKWSDGRALTANDVLFTWNDIIYNEHFINPLAETFSIDGKPFVVTKVDDLTVRFVTPKPFAAFVPFVGNVPVVPRHVLRGYVQERRFTEFYGISTPSFRLIGSGPYRFNQYAPGESTILDRNELYHRVDANGSRLPYIETLVFRSVPTPDNLAHRFLTNRLDVAEGIRFEDLEILQAATKTNDHQALDLGPGAEPRLLWFNQNTNSSVASHRMQWFRDVRFRRAINLAIDRSAIIDGVFGGKAGLPDGFVTAGSSRWRNGSLPAFQHNPVGAAKVLDEMGLRKDDAGRLRDDKGRPVGFSIKLARGSALSSAVADTLRTQLEDLGIQVSIEHVEFPALLHSLDTKFDYEAVLMGFGGGVPDPQTARDILRSDGPMHFWFPRQTAAATEWEKQIDELFIRQRGELNFNQRKQTMDEIQQILARELPFIPLVHRHVQATARTKLGNLKPRANAPFPLTWNLEELFLQ